MASQQTFSNSDLNSDTMTEQVVNWIIENSEQSAYNAWKSIWDHCGSKLAGVLKNSGATDSQEINDTMHEAMSELFYNILRGAFRGESALCTYYIAIGKRRWLRMQREKKKKRVLADKHFVEPAIPPNQQRTNWRKIIADSFSDSSCADLLIEYYFVYQAHYKSLAEAVKRPHEDTEKVYERVRRQVNRCLQKLRKNIRREK